MAEKKPYDERSDIEKIESQWKKINGLLTREDWSAAVVRAATACELAATFAIRKEFAEHGAGFSTHFVDALLKKANGLQGKVDNILTPLFYKIPRYSDIRRVFEIGKEINKKRNDIAHRGEFCSRREASELVEKCRVFVTTVVAHYEEGFSLSELNFFSNEGD